MIQRHIIRLRAPWWGIACPNGDQANASGEEFKATTPFSWPEQIPANFTGTVKMSRKFNCSSGMSDADEVWLTISSLAAPAEIRFNGSAIATVMPQENFEIAVSKLLKPFNELQILLELSGDLPNPLMGDVAVEIAS